MWYKNQNISLSVKTFHGTRRNQLLIGKNKIFGDGYGMSIYIQGGKELETFMSGYGAMTYF